MTIQTLHHFVFWLRRSLLLRTRHGNRSIYIWLHAVFKMVRDFCLWMNLWFFLRLVLFCAATTRERPLGDDGMNLWRKPHQCMNSFLFFLFSTHVSLFRQYCSPLCIIGMMMSKTSEASKHHMYQPSVGFSFLSKEAANNQRYFFSAFFSRELSRQSVLLQQRRSQKIHYRGGISSVLVQSPFLVPCNAAMMMIVLTTSFGYSFAYPAWRSFADFLVFQDRTRRILLVDWGRFRCQLFHVAFAFVSWWMCHSFPLLAHITFRIWL